jgi:phosphatidylglycerol lysyltransferase
MYGVPGRTWVAMGDLLAPADVAAHAAALRRVSDQWLAAKAAAEKGFSLGFFDEAYVRRFPAGVIECGGAIQAFATVWPGASGTELSVDVMRLAPDAPKNVMEALLVHVMRWGRDAGCLALPRVLAEVSALVAGGYRRIFTKRVMAERRTRA